MEFLSTFIYDHREFIEDEEDELYLLQRMVDFEIENESEEG